MEIIVFNNADFIKLVNDKDFVTKMLVQETPEDVQGLFAENGVDVTLDEINDLGKAIYNASHEDDSETLSESELDSVAGGVIEWVAVGKIVVAAGGAALSLYKWYKSR